MKLIEVTIILITILMVLGLVLTSMENANEKVMKTQEINNMEKLTSEVVDNLINNLKNERNKLLDKDTDLYYEIEELKEKLECIE